MQAFIKKYAVNSGIILFFGVIIVLAIREPNVSDLPASKSTEPDFTFKNVSITMWEGQKKLWHLKSKGASLHTQDYPSRMTLINGIVYEGGRVHYFSAPTAKFVWGDAALSLENAKVTYNMDTNPVLAFVRILEFDPDQQVLNGKGGVTVKSSYGQFNGQWFKADLPRRTALVYGRPQAQFNLDK